MKTLIGFLLLFAFVLFAQGCATPEQQMKDSGAELLTQSELEELFSVDRTARIVANKGTTVTVSYSPGGSQKVTYAGGSDEGSYRFDNGMFCSKWNKIRDGKEKCGRFYKIDENEYVSVSSDGKNSIKIYFD